MKNNILTLILIIISSGIIAQTSNLTIYSKNGEGFLIMLNGLRENDAPKSNVQIYDIQPNRYAMKVIFEDPSLAPIDKVIYVEPNIAYTMEIKTKNDSGLGKGLKKAGNVIAKDLSKEFNNDTINMETKTEYVIRLVSAIELVTNPEPISPSANYQNTQNQNTQNQNTENVNMNVGVNMDETSFSTNVQVNTNYTETGTQQSTNTATIQQQDAGCQHTMSSADYAAASQTISSKSFEDSKLQIAKQITKSNCLTAEQVKGFMRLFTYESSKLDFAKFAYQFTFDKGNYFKINDVFTYSSSIDELDEFLSGK